MTPGSRAHMIHGQPARAELTLPPVAAAEKAREMREYRARKAEGKAKTNGRPRAEGPPSKAAIRLREARAKKKEAA